MFFQGEPVATIIPMDWGNQNLLPTAQVGIPLLTNVSIAAVMGKVKDFLEVISEANKRLQKDAGVCLDITSDIFLISISWI